MRVAIVSDALFVYGGAERVIEQLLDLYPQADVFALVDFLPADQRGFLGGRPVTTTFVQHLPWARRTFRAFLHLWPLAIEQLDLRAYDLVISSHHAVAHGVVTGPDQTHVVYTHSPMRYAWDLQHEYLQPAGAGRGSGGLAGWWIRRVLHNLRIWDHAAGQRADMLIANSAFIGQRVRKCYGRTAEVVHPPVHVGKLPFSAEKDDYYLTLARLAPYKRIDLVVEAFRRMPDRRLVVCGSGASAKGLGGDIPPNVSVVGWQPEAEVHRLLGRARALVFAGIEDFGIAAVEAQACGTAVVALGRGGSCETVRDISGPLPTGVLFAEQTAESLIDGIDRLEALRGRIDPHNCRRNAETFAAARFQSEFEALVDRALAGEPMSPIDLDDHGIADRRASRRALLATAAAR
ncbi:MAG TPA: glycosyltransferase [Geminicoccaceae bacterium]|nr:glycosyltransferase [Geminicoccus sp.]HMU51155.1 glycosyltransferase [Geminicoccaceae bacterium]